MAVTAAAGIVGFGPQNGKSTDVGYAPATEFYRHKATQVDLAVLDDTRLGDPEVGGRPVPTFPYKAGIMVAGGATLQPRLEDTLGWLLYALMGDVTTVGAADYTHTFTFSNDPSEVKWMTFKKYIPKKDGVVGTDVGEIYEDCKLTGMSFTLASDAPLQTRLDVLGRTFELDHNADLWAWENTYEDYPTIPIGCHTSGYIEVEGERLPIVQATVSFANQPLDARSERVYGSPYLEDITIVQRQLSFDLLVKWNNPELYTQVLTGQPTGTEWSAQPFVGSFEVKMATFETVGETGVEYSLTIRCPVAMLAMNGGITLAGGQAVMMRFNGIALDNDAEYAEFVLVNGVQEYAWPALDVVAPTHVSSTLGAVNSSTIVSTFSETVVSPTDDYSTGFTVNVNAAPVPIIHAYRGENRSQIYLVLQAPAVAGDAITLEYSALTGDITDLAGLALATFAPQVVTNTLA
jgi:hypothetical protein